MKFFGQMEWKIEWFKNNLRVERIWVPNFGNLPWEALGWETFKLFGKKSSSNKISLNPLFGNEE